MFHSDKLTIYKFNFFECKIKLKWCELQGASCTVQVSSENGIIILILMPMQHFAVFLHLYSV